MPSDSWPPGPNAPVLGLSDVHVWRSTLDWSMDNLDRFRAHLSQDERQRAASFYFERHRNHYIAARGILRELLARYLRRAPAEFHFTYSAFGKPSLGGDVRFNVSHSHGLALFAFAATDIGVDVERLRSELAGQEIAQRFFAPEEAVKLSELPPDARVPAFFRCWTRKEAFIKAHGSGLSLPLSKFTVEFCGAPQLLSTAFDPAEAERWRLYALEPGAGHAGAVAARGHHHEVQCFDFTIPEPRPPSRN